MVAPPWLMLRLPLKKILLDEPLSMGSRNERHTVYGAKMRLTLEGVECSRPHIASGI